MHFCCSKFFFLDLIRGTLHKSEFKIIITYVMLAFDVATLPSSLQAHLKVLLLGAHCTQQLNTVLCLQPEFCAWNDHIIERSAVCNVIWHQTFTAVWSLSLFLLRIRAYVGIWTFCCVWFEHSPFLQYNSCDIYDMYTELYLVYLATTRLDPHLISDLPYIFVAQIYHGVTQLLQICHPSWEFSIPSHPRGAQLDSDVVIMEAIWVQWAHCGEALAQVIY